MEKVLVMNAMFIHNPKTAGLSIEEGLGLMPVRTPSKFRKWFTNNGQYSFGHLDVRKRLKSGAISKDFYNSAFKFCFCRNPFDRAVSHYFYVRKKHSDKFSPKVSFIDFTRTLGNYRFFRLQTYYTDGLDFDFIGRFENLEEDFKKVAAIIGKSCQLREKNKTDHRPYWEYYNDESIANIQQYYKKDFDFFGYDNNLLHG